MIVCVCGGRNYNDARRVFDELDALNPRPTLLIHGAAPGADAIARRWAQLRGVPNKAYVALWGLHGRAAGPIRNREMAAHPGLALVVAFPGGRGTRSMVEEARKSGVDVREVEE